MAKVNSRRKPAAVPNTEPATRRGEERRAALLRAARDVFLEKGYAGTSVEAVMAKVGGSKASLYSYFGNKDGLFENIIRAQCDEFLANLAIPREPSADLEKDLTQFAQRAFGLFTDPKRVAMLRVMIGEAARFPQLAERLYANGPKRGLAMLAELLRRAHAAGQIHCPYPEVSAIHFMEMIKGHAQWRALLGLPLFPEGIEPGIFVREAVRTFLGGCRRA